MITETLKSEISKYLKSGYLYSKQYRELLDIAINNNTDRMEFDKYLDEELEKNNCRRELSYREILNFKTLDTRNQCLWNMLYCAAIVETDSEEAIRIFPESECKKAIQKYPNDAEIVGVVEQIKTSLFAKENAKKNFYLKIGIIIVIFLAIIFIGNGKKNKPTVSSSPVKTETTVQTQTIRARSTMENPPTTTFPGEYPVVSERLISAAEIAGCSKEELKIMRNEIFARHGYIFKTKDMKTYFGKQKWYKGKYYDVNNLLSDIEIYNIKVIQQVEKL